MKRIYLIGVLWALAQISRAQEQSTPAVVSSPAPAPLSSLQEAAGVNITRQWAEKSYSAMELQPGPDGAVRFRFGEAMPTIVTAPLNVTDVALQPGEVINEVKAGDSERFLIEPAVSGDEAKVEHVVIKPKAPDLQTSLIITTDRRTYHLRLVSHATDYMAFVSFLYPNEPAKVAADPPSTPKQEDPKPDRPKVQVAMMEPARKKRTVRGVDGKATVFLGRAEGPSRTDVKDHNFRIQGSAPFRPTQVYTDGRKTYIELPENVQETPVLFRLKKGGLFGWGHQMAEVNARVHGRWYVADTVLDKAALVSGVGSSKQAVTITRAK